MEPICVCLKDFLNIGCEDQLNCALAARVFVDMKLDKCYVSIDKCYEKTLGVAYLRAHLDQCIVMVLPLLCQQDFDFRLIGKFQCKVANSAENNKLILAICDASTNILYYNVGNGFLE